MKRMLAVVVLVVAVLHAAFAGPVPCTPENTVVKWTCHCQKDRTLIIWFKPDPSGPLYGGHFTTIAGALVGCRCQGSLTADQYAEVLAGLERNGFWQLPAASAGAGGDRLEVRVDGQIRVVRLGDHDGSSALRAWLHDQPTVQSTRAVLESHVQHPHP